MDFLLSVQLHFTINHLLYVLKGRNINNEKAIAKIPPRTNAKIGDVVSLGINTTNVHLFDIETENAIAVR